MFLIKRTVASFFLSFLSSTRRNRFFYFWTGRDVSPLISIANISEIVTGVRDGTRSVLFYSTHTPLFVFFVCLKVDTF